MSKAKVPATAGWNICRSLDARARVCVCGGGGGDLMELGLLLDSVTNACDEVGPASAAEATAAYHPSAQALHTAPSAPQGTISIV